MPSEGLVAQIVDAEWDFFQGVTNEGGRASCQDDHPTFWVMRSAQVECWPDDLAQSWAADLASMKAADRNPMVEKYARMMEGTAPGDFAKLRDYLPAVDPEEQRLAAQVAHAMATWTQEAYENYPLMVGRGRPFFSESDGRGVSVETYARCELESFSRETLERYAAFCEDLQAKGESLYLLVQGRVAQKLGYASLGELERSLATSSPNACCHHSEALS